MPALFKELEEKDLGEVKAIYDWYIKNSTATFHTEPIKPDELLEFLYINHPVYKSYLIGENGQVAGYCYLTNHKKRQAYNRTAEITIYLKPEFCQKGLGSLALKYLEEKARESNLKNLIGVISGDNTGSITLFEKSGYTKCAHFRNVGEKFNQLLDVVAFQKEI